MAHSLLSMESNRLLLFSLSTTHWVLWFSTSVSKALSLSGTLAIRDYTSSFWLIARVVGLVTITVASLLPIGSGVRVGASLNTGFGPLVCYNSGMDRIPIDGPVTV